MAARAIDKLILSEDLDVLGWREVPTDGSMLGTVSHDAMPGFHQVFVGGGRSGATGTNLERRVLHAAQADRA